ncbi:hypothetical protein H311_01447 [Anncaliia algerae PRA109]|nr:hypothetical protein H311_01447 [Anncaliia algerae PRA109]
MDDAFKDKALVKKRFLGDVYELEREDGRRIKRHSSQMRRFKKGEVGGSDWCKNQKWNNTNQIPRK